MGKYAMMEFDNDVRRTATSMSSGFEVMYQIRAAFSVGRKDVVKGIKKLMGADTNKQRLAQKVKNLHLESLNDTTKWEVKINSILK